jgi:hypothetical protein
MVPASGVGKHRSPVYQFYAFERKLSTLQSRTTSSASMRPTAAKARRASCHRGDCGAVYSPNDALKRTRSEGNAEHA